MVPVGFEGRGRVQLVPDFFLARTTEQPTGDLVVHQANSVPNSLVVARQKGCIADLSRETVANELEPWTTTPTAHGPFSQESNRCE